jgi:hypothetical protein
VLNNALNNNITLVKLRKTIRFKPIQKRLRYISHIINLIAKLYIFGQDISTFEENYIKASPKERQKL